MPNIIHLATEKILTDQVLARSREALVVLEVVEEILHIGLEVVDRARRSDETVHLHGAVETVEELPCAASDGDHALRGADGVHIVPAKPISHQSQYLLLKALADIV